MRDHETTLLHLPDYRDPELVRRSACPWRRQCTRASFISASAASFIRMTDSIIWTSIGPI